MATSILVSEFQTPLGQLILGSYGDLLCLCDWRYRKMRSSIDHRIMHKLSVGYVDKKSAVVEHARKELLEYFDGERTEFTVPLLMIGTDFQKKVWKALEEIPFGKTITYLDLSKRLGDPRAIRAVASANGANALSLLVPCHRVIGQDGSMLGYAGGVTAKSRLLDLEGAHSQSRLSL